LKQSKSIKLANTAQVIRKNVKKKTRTFKRELKKEQIQIQQKQEGEKEKKGNG